MKHCIKKQEDNNYKIPNRSGKIKRLVYNASANNLTKNDQTSFINNEDRINKESDKSCTYYCDEHDFLTDNLYTILHHHGLVHCSQNEDSLSTRKHFFPVI